MRLWNISFSSSKNCLLGSILPVVSCAFSLRPLLSFQYTSCPTCQSVQCDLQRPSVLMDSLTPVPIAMTIFLEITSPVIRALVTTSFTFTRNSSSKRFGLPFLLCTVAFSFFLSFSIFLF